MLSLGLADLIGAWIYRLARPDLQRRTFRFDPVIGRVHRTGVSIRYAWPAAPRGYLQFDFNNRGFRESADTSLEKNEEYRVIVFGDSHTQGAVDTEQSYPNATEAILRSRSRSVEVINAGVGRFSLYQQLLLFREHLDLKPDLVVFTLFCGNDYSDVMRERDNPRLVLNERGDVVSEPPEPTSGPSGPRLAEYSLTLRLWDRLKSRRAERRAEPTIMEQAVRINRGAVWQSMSQARYFLRPPERRALATRLHEHVVDEISKLADREGLEAWFVLLPTKYQIEPNTQAAELGRLEEMLGLDPGNKFEDWVYADFGGIVRERGLTLVDPREAFIASPEELYWSEDHHLNVAGSRKLGELLADEIDRFIAGIDARSEP